jgi:CRISPR-associated protein Csm2
MTQWNRGGRPGAGGAGAFSAPPRPQGVAPQGQGGSVDKAKIRQVIEQDDARELVRLAEEYGRRLAEQKLTASQIRGIFSAVRGLEGRWVTDSTRKAAAGELVLLKPKLAYQAARNEPVKLLKEMLEPALEVVGEDEARFRRFVDYFEALLAYHKAFGGKD